MIKIKVDTIGDKDLVELSLCVQGNTFNILRELIAIVNNTLDSINMGVFTLDDKIDTFCEMLKSQVQEEDDTDDE